MDMLREMILFSIFRPPGMFPKAIWGRFLCGAPRVRRGGWGQRHCALRGGRGPASQEVIVIPRKLVEFIF